MLKASRDVWGDQIFPEVPSWWSGVRLRIVPSAFPKLPENADELPAIPGGWRREVIQAGARTFELWRPSDPDLFLDDQDVLEENARNDYMPYWAFLWPASIKMASQLAKAPWAAGSEVLELGSGLGLVGLASLARGDLTIFSDYDQTALYVCRLNARLNGLPDPGLLRLDWRDPPARQFPVIIGCEVVYDAAMHPVLLRLLDRMLTSDGVCWIADPGRYQAEAFYKRCREAGWNVTIRDENGALLSAPSDQFQIFEIRR